MTNYKLHYYDVKGRGEPIRMVFALAQVDYEDVRIPYNLGGKNEIPAELKKRLPYAQVPYLEFGDNGGGLSQTVAIGRFLARRFGLMGNSDVEAAKIDEVIDAAGDFGQAFGPLWVPGSDEAKAAAKKKIVAEVIPKYIGKFNEIVEKNGTGFIVGDKVSLADVIIFCNLEMAQFMVQVDLTQEYPGIKKLSDKLLSIPQFKKWIDTRSNTLI